MCIRDVYTLDVRLDRAVDLSGLSSACENQQFLRAVALSVEAMLDYARALSSRMYSPLS